ncbi:hypothetical protein GCM10017620_21250 [Brevundimonas intermedia]|uniref:Uncharacterized protein n=1 Tax=Brevundimonas intermedia TaxID=74315 RepID=A0ABQ5TAI2_9CAUL|nr:hypothetical protein GCM10017620_21250 [Brevundimonas intermedia]
MPGVGHQGGGIRDQARAELADDESQIDHQADGVAPVAGVHRPVSVAVSVVMPMAMVMMAMVVIMVVICVVVICVVVSVRGAHVSAYTPFPQTAKLLYDNALNVIM